MIDKMSKTTPQKIVKRPIMKPIKPAKKSKQAPRMITQMLKAIVKKVRGNHFFKKSKNKLNIIMKKAIRKTISMMIKKIEMLQL